MSSATIVSATIAATRMPTPPHRMERFFSFGFRGSLNILDGDGYSSDVSYGLGGLLGYDFLFGDRFALSLSLGAEYSSRGNPEWSLYAPALRFDNLDGTSRKGQVIPYFRLALGVAF